LSEFTMGLAGDREGPLGLFDDADLTPDDRHDD
jgi:hypothetical protein